MGGWVAGLFGNITNSAPNWVGLGLGLSLAKSDEKKKKEISLFDRVRWGEKEAERLKVRIRMDRLKVRIHEQNKVRLALKLNSALQSKKNKLKIESKRKRWEMFKMRVKEAGEDIKEIQDALISVIPERKTLLLQSKLDDGRSRQPGVLKTVDNNVVNTDIEIDDCERQPEDLKTVENVDSRISQVGHIDTTIEKNDHFPDYSAQIKTKNTPPLSPIICNSTNIKLKKSVSSFVMPPTITENLMQSTVKYPEKIVTEQPCPVEIFGCQTELELKKEDVEPCEKLAPVFLQRVTEKERTKIRNEQQITRKTTKTKTINKEKMNKEKC